MRYFTTSNIKYRELMPSGRADNDMAESGPNLQFVAAWDETN